MLEFRHESMGPQFDKWHVDGLPRPAVFHHFTQADKYGDPHDHPWGFTSFVISGGYTEEVFEIDGSSKHVSRFTGTSFHIPARHIHRIVHMPATGCWTLILPEPWERTSCFWQFREDGAYYREWHEAEWRRA